VMGVLGVQGLSNEVGKLLVRSGDNRTALEMDRDMRYPRSDFITSAPVRVRSRQGETDGLVRTSTSDSPDVISIDETVSPRGMGVTIYAALMLCVTLGMSLCGGVAGGVLGTQKPRRPDPLDHANWRDEIDILDQ
jgi:hypothetical protein